MKELMMSNSYKLKNLKEQLGYEKADYYKLLNFSDFPAGTYCIIKSIKGIEFIEITGWIINLDQHKITYRSLITDRQGEIETKYTYALVEKFEKVSQVNRFLEIRNSSINAVDKIFSSKTRSSHEDLIDDVFIMNLLMAKEYEPDLDIDLYLKYSNLKKKESNTPVDISNTNQLSDKEKVCLLINSSDMIVKNENEKVITLKKLEDIQSRLSTIEVVMPLISRDLEKLHYIEKRLTSVESLTSGFKKLGPLQFGGASNKNSQVGINAFSLNGEIISRERIVKNDE